MSSAPRSILVIQLRRIGDLILTTPLLGALRARYPDARITLLASEECGQILPAIGGADRVLVHRRQGGNARLWLGLLGRAYDTCIDCTGSDRSCLVAWMSKATLKIGFERFKNLGLRRFVFNAWVKSSVRDRHTVDHLLDLLQPLHIPPPADPQPALILPPEAVGRAQRLIEQHALGEGFAVLHPGTARREKFWLPDRWAEVAEHLHGRDGLKIVLTGGTDEMETEHLRRIESHLSVPAVNLAGQIDLATAVALIGKCRILVGVDSAPLHIASAFRVPQVGLFGPTNPFHWCGKYPGAVALVAGDPENRSVPKHPDAPMNALSTGRVIRAIESLLDPPANDGSAR